MGVFLKSRSLFSEQQHRDDSFENHRRRLPRRRFGQNGIKLGN